jgi:hypothetical protein
MRIAACVLPCLGALFFSGLSNAATGQAAKPIIDNERVAVWDITWNKGIPSPIARHQYDFITVYLTGGTIRTTRPDGITSTVSRKAGDALFQHKDEVRSEEGVSDRPARSIVIELKDQVVPPLPNKSGYPNAFPRPRVKKVLENNSVIVWDYTWLPETPTPMHFHDKDVVVVYFDNGSLKSTTPDGQSVVNDYSFGLTRFNRRDRIHTELLVKGAQHAVMTELK